MSYPPLTADEAETFFDFQCPCCNQAVSFPPTAIGQAHECPLCGQTLIVPPEGTAVGGRLPIPITTAQLTLRRFQPGDQDDVAELMSHEELFPHTDGQSMDEESVREWLAGDAKITFTTPDQTFYLAVVRNDTDRVIGWVSLTVEAPLRHQASVFVVIAVAHQRQGYGTEALTGLLGFCFLGVHLHRVEGCCDNRNEAGPRLMEKAGMRYEGQFLGNRPDLDGWADTLWFGLLEREWPPVKTS